MHLAQFIVSVIGLALLMISFMAYDDSKYHAMPDADFSANAGVVGILLIICNAIMSVVTHSIYQ